jgi:phospholipid/cholesterol/gamma-HCH transport system substrate-binding protein
MKKMNTGLDTWTTLGSNLITSRDRLDQIFVRADSIADGLQQGKGTLGKLLNDSAVADELKTLVVKANHSMDDLQVTLKNLQNASGNLQAASTNLPAISDALGNEAKDLPGLVLQTQSSMRELERLIDGMQRHWLLRKYINMTNPPPLSPNLSALPSPGSSIKGSSR